MSESVGIHLLVLALGGTLLLGAYHGYRGGLVRSAFKLLGLVAGLLLARPAAVAVEPSLEELLHFPGSWYVLIIACFVGIVLIFGLVGWLISLMIRWTPLGWIDKLGGAALGLLLGLFVAGLLLGLLDNLELLSPLLAEAQGWEAEFLQLLLDITPGLFDGLEALLDPEKLRVPRGAV